MFARQRNFTISFTIWRSVGGLGSLKGRDASLARIKGEFEDRRWGCIFRVRAKANGAKKTRLVRGANKLQWDNGKRKELQVITAPVVLTVCTKWLIIVLIWKTNCCNYNRSFGLEIHSVKRWYSLQQHSFIIKVVERSDIKHPRPILFSIKPQQRF